MHNKYAYYNENDAYFTMHSRVTDLRYGEFDWRDVHMGGCLDAPNLIPIGSSTFGFFGRGMTGQDFITRFTLAQAYKEWLIFDAWLKEQAAQLQA